jgi:hypothetical protein
MNMCMWLMKLDASVPYRRINLPSLILWNGRRIYQWWLWNNSFPTHISNSRWCSSFSKKDFIWVCWYICNRHMWLHTCLTRIKKHKIHNKIQKWKNIIWWLIIAKCISTGVKVYNCIFINVNKFIKIIIKKVFFNKILYSNNCLLDGKLYYTFVETVHHTVLNFFQGGPIYLGCGPIFPKGWVNRPTFIFIVTRSKCCLLKIFLVHNGHQMMLILPYKY